MILRTLLAVFSFVLLNTLTAQTSAPVYAHHELSQWPAPPPAGPEDEASPRKRLSRAVIAGHGYKKTDRLKEMNRHVIVYTLVEADGSVTVDSAVLYRILRSAEPRAPLELERLVAATDYDYRSGRVRLIKDGVQRSGQERKLLAKALRIVEELPALEAGQLDGIAVRSYLPINVDFNYGQLR